MSQQHVSTLGSVLSLVLVDILIWIAVYRYPKGQNRRLLFVGGVGVLVAIVLLLSTVAFS